MPSQLLLTGVRVTTRAMWTHASLKVMPTQLEAVTTTLLGVDPSTTASGVSSMKEGAQLKASQLSGENPTIKTLSVPASVEEMLLVTLETLTTILTGTLP